MKIKIVTSCTGEKLPSPGPTLLRPDFTRGAAYLAALERTWAVALLPAGRRYTGAQHRRLMHGVTAARLSPALAIDVQILSAGYGLVGEARPILPYEVTFAGMRSAELAAWSTHLGIPAQMQQYLAEPCDLGLVLLGEDYLAACQLPPTLPLGGPTVFLCGTVAAARLPLQTGAHLVTLGNQEAKQMRCGSIGLKGEVAGRLLRLLARQEREFLPTFLASTAPLHLLGTPQPPLPRRPAVPISAGLRLNFSG